MFITLARNSKSRLWEDGEDNKLAYGYFIKGLMKNDKRGKLTNKKNWVLTFRKDDDVEDFVGGVLGLLNLIWSCVETITKINDFLWSCFSFYFDLKVLNEGNNERVNFFVLIMNNFWAIKQKGVNIV